MKQDQHVTPAPLDRMGQHMAQLLTSATSDLPHDLVERLRVARQQALAAHQPALLVKPRVLAEGSSLSLAGVPGEGLGWWGTLGSALPLLALVMGLVALDWVTRESVVSELAEIDAALLADDLPPAAYSDPGFMQFLRQPAPARPSVED